MTEHTPQIKGQNSNNDPQKITQKTKDWAASTP